MDKLRRTYTIPVSFSDGEQPSAAKLTALSSQSRNALGIVERAIGDPWNQSGDPILTATTANALHIPNIARALGDLGLLNPRTFIPSTTALYSDPIGVRYVGQHTGYLLYPPAVDPTVGTIFTLTGNDTFLVPSQFKPFVTWGTDQPRIPGDWTIDQDGKLYSVSPIPVTLVIAYVPDVIGETNSSDNANGGTFSVIPDPDTWGGAFAGLRVERATTEGYYLHLPPRQPFFASGSRFTARTPTFEGNFSTTPEGTTLLTYQSPGFAASSQPHYRYSLPSQLRGLAAGSTYPSGFLYLWDQTRGTIVEGVTYRVPSDRNRAYVIHVTGTDLDNLFAPAGIITTDDMPASYTSRFKLIIVGTSVASSLSALWQRFLDHRHGRTDSNVVSHNSLRDAVTPPRNAVVNPNYPTEKPLLLPSKWTNDSHSQYLHRAGATNSSDTRRDFYDNAMLGPLLMAAEGELAGGTNDWTNTTFNSFPIHFGNFLRSRLIRGISQTTDSVIDRGLGLDGGINAGVTEPIILIRNRLQFGLGPQRGILLKDSNYFKFGVSGSNGVATVGNAGLVANSITLNRSTADLRTTPSESPLTIPYVHLGHQSSFGERGLLRITGMPLLISVNSSIANQGEIRVTNRGGDLAIHDMALEADRRLEFGFRPVIAVPGHVGIRKTINSDDLHHLTWGGLAARGMPGGTTGDDSFSTLGLHVHNVWAAVRGGPRDNTVSPGVGHANQIGVIAGRFSFSARAEATESSTVTFRLTFINNSVDAITVASQSRVIDVFAILSQALQPGSWRSSFSDPPLVILSTASIPLATFYSSYIAQVSITNEFTTDFLITFPLGFPNSIRVYDLNYLVIGPIRRGNA